MGIIDEHYEKVAAGVGALSLVGLTTLGVLSIPKVGDLKTKHNGQATKNTKVSPEYDLLLEDVIASTSSDIKIDSKYISPSDKREARFLSSIDLFGRKGEEQLIDLYADGAPQVHPGFSNKWWKKNGLEDLMGYKNAPEYDSDGDQFSNREELQANSNPKSITSYPPLFPRLEGESVDVHKFALSFTTCTANKEIYLKLHDLAAKFKEETDVLKINDTAFQSVKPKMKRYKNRFTYKSQVQKRHKGFMQPFITLKDKNGSEVGVFRHGKTIVEDRSVDLKLNALGKGSETKKFKVGDTFSLPFGNKKKLYKVVSILPPASEGAPYKVLIQGPGGARKVIEIQSNK